MYPSLLPYLRSDEGANVQTSLSRAFPLDGQIRRSWIARSTFSSKLQLLAVSQTLWDLAKG